MKKILLGCVSALALASCATVDTTEEAVNTAAIEAETTSTEVTEAAKEMTGKAEKAAEVDLSTSAQLNGFFEQQFMLSVMRSPMTQTYLNIKKDYDKLDDVSDARAREDLKLAEEALQQMRDSFDYDELSDADKLSYRLFKMQVKNAKAGFKYRYYGYTFNQMFGAHSTLPAFMINQHRVNNRDDAEAYISRLNDVKRFMGQNIEGTRQSAKMNIRPPRFVYDYVLDDAKNVITGAPFDEGKDSPLLADFKSKLDKIDLDDTAKATLLTEAIDALNTSVKPAYDELIDYMNTDKAKATTDDGAWKHLNGDAYYAHRLKRMTTTDLTADEIHEIGLSEVARIHDEMREIMGQVGFEGSLQEFFVFMREDDQFYYSNDSVGRDRYLKEATEMIDIMKEELPSTFAVLPKADIKVKRVEEFREKSAGKAFYQRPSPDGARPGTYYANLYDMRDMPTYQMEALAYHEGIPGHHMQIAIAQELEGIPKFRKFGGFTAYIEGWGLYSEYLPKEMGFYKDPYSDFGRLAMELWRAGRLVVDTGLHHKKWTREEAQQYLIDNTPNAVNDCKKAIDRYIVMPGQATAYKIGMLKILELREGAKETLGDAFDIREFHSVVLKDGPVPLSILEEKVNAWVKAKQG